MCHVCVHTAELWTLQKYDHLKVEVVFSTAPAEHQGVRQEQRGGVLGHRGWEDEL